MRAPSIESVAAEILRCAVSWEPNVCLLGNVRAVDVARAVQQHVTCCPSCGAEPWVNIDCRLCRALAGADETSARLAKPDHAPSAGGEETGRG